MQIGRETKRFFTLLADEIYYTGQYLRRRRGVLPGEIVQQIYAMGYRSFPIICLITFLIGITISLTSAAQLKLFGADIYLADLIGIAMIKELVPLMVGIMLAGKIGASITAEIATMKVMDEIDALRTMGIVPEKFLMVPRLIAITLVVPLLVALADFVGIVGGVLVGQAGPRHPAVRLLPRGHRRPSPSATFSSAWARPWSSAGPSSSPRATRDSSSSAGRRGWARPRPNPWSCPSP